MDERTCRQCGTTKPLSDFYARRNGREIDGFCKPCRLAQQREYAAARKEHKRAYDQKYRSTYRESRQEQDRAYYAAHSETIKARTNNARIRDIPAYNAQKRAQWHRQHDTSVTRSHRYLAKKAGQSESFTTEEWRDLCTKYGNACLACGEKRKLSPDHIIPRSKGGHSRIENIQPLCDECNNRKGSRTIDYRPLH